MAYFPPLRPWREGGSVSNAATVPTERWAHGLPLLGGGAVRVRCGVDIRTELAPAPPQKRHRQKTRALRRMDEAPATDASTSEATRATTRGMVLCTGTRMVGEAMGVVDQVHTHTHMYNWGRPTPSPRVLVVGRLQRMDGLIHVFPDPSRCVMHHPCMSAGAAGVELFVGRERGALRGVVFPPRAMVPRQQRGRAGPVRRGGDGRPRRSRQQPEHDPRCVGRRQPSAYRAPTYTI